MAISRVDFGGQTLIDLTEDTVTASTLAVGATAHGANGELVRGALAPSASGVESFNGRTGSVMPVGGDYTDDQISLSSTMHIGGETQTTVKQALMKIGENKFIKEATESEWESMTQEEKDDLNVVWLLPWKNPSGGGSVVVNDRINNQTYPLKKITLSTSDPTDDYIFEKGEIWLTYGNVT